MRKLIAAMKMSVDGKVTPADWVAAWSDDYGLTPQIDACIIGGKQYPSTRAIGPQYKTIRKSRSGPTSRQRRLSWNGRASPPRLRITCFRRRWLWLSGR